ncbi:hypothetical protein [Janibacter sp. G1551]|uniref:hypothetical protein n=1 Tax=Janibacter sp. G1551 TaxID=3420440 RepID=UPI003D0446C2
MTTKTAIAAPDGPENYRSSEGLRALLCRLHEGGQSAWKHDPVAAELMVYACEKYAPLASKHGLDPWEAASAAFDVMRTKAARTADDPWAVITHAVRITCIFEERAQGLLCSVHQARRPHISVFHDPERFSDRENPLTDYHPAFHIHDQLNEEDTTSGADSSGRRANAMSAAEDAIGFLVLVGWPADVARAGVQHICGVLMRAGSRQSAFESLRRDRYARALLDVPTSCWHTLLRTLLGNPDPALAASAEGRGMLLRLVAGEPISLLLRDDDLVLALALAASRIGGEKR